MGYKINYSVYKITNKITNQCYIGVDSYFPKRLRQHQSMLYNNKHKNKHLQYSYNKYSIENFSFTLLLSCKSRNEMLQKEIQFIKEYNSITNGYNHTIGGEGSHGYKHSIESLEKMSSWKRIITPEWCKAISIATKGKPKRKGIIRKNHPNYSKWLGGEKHPVAKFKQAEVDKMRELYCKGISLNELSKKYNTSKTYVCSIVNNIFWKDANYIKNIITKHIICIEDNLEFNSPKEVLNYYNIKSNSTLNNNLSNKNKFIKTKYGKKSFKKVSSDTQIPRKSRIRVYYTIQY